jgi:hypothetical protein
MGSGVLTGGVLTGGTFTGGVLTGGVLTGGVLTGGVLTGGTFTGGVLTGGTFTGGLLTGGVFTGGLLTGGAFTGGLLTGGVLTGGVFTGGALTGGVSTGGVSTGGVSTGAVTGGGGLVAASIPPVAPGMALVAPAAVSEVSDGVVDVTPVAAVEGVVAEALGQTTAKAAPSAASRVASQRRPKRWLSRGLNTTGKLPPQIARTLSVLALVLRDALPHRSPEPQVSQTPITTSTPGRGARITSFRGGRGVKRGRRRARSRSLGSPRPERVTTT